MQTPRVETLEGRMLLSAVPTFDHVVVVVEENHSPSQVIGSAEAPYINSLAKNGAYLSQSHGTHRPSQPNYIALFSGSNQGVTTNDNVNLGNIANLGSQLIGAGKAFVNYSEGLPSVGYTGATSGRYARKHNPAVSFSNVPAASNRPFTDFPTDYAKLPTVSFVVPNLDNDSHDGTVDESDTWLEEKLSGYATWAKAHNSLLIVTYDEGDLGDASNRIPTIFFGAGVKTGTYANNINHYNVLRTVEGIYGLTPLANAATAAPIDYIWNGTTPPVLNAPVDLTALAVSGTQVNLAWTDNNAAETGYKIERSTDGKTFSPLAGTGVNGHSYNNTGLTAGKKYYYRAFAVNATATGGFSNIASAATPTGSPTPTPTPTAPSALAATAASASTINLVWADNSANETGFRIERSTDGTTFTFLANVAANVKTYASTGLAAATKYYYRVQAIGSPNSSAFSSIATGTTQSGTTPGAPAAPSGLTVRASTSVAGAIDLSWADQSTNETNFKIERSTDGKTFYALAGTGANGTFYRNTGLTAGKKYYYRVYAVNAAGSSVYSNVASMVL